MEIKVYPGAALHGVCAELGEKKFKKLTRKKIAERARQFGMTSTDYQEDVLGRAGRSKLYRAIEEPQFNDLAIYLRTLGVHIVLQESRVPWNTWKPGSAVVVIMGERTEPSGGDSSRFDRQVVTQRDVEALTALNNGLTRILDIDYRIEIKAFPINMSSDEAEEELKELRDRKDVGAIVVLGSDVANPLADPIARAIADDYICNGQSLPVQFRWLPSAGRKMPDSQLSNPTPCEPDEIGIEIFAKDQLVHRVPRTLDEKIFETISGNNDPSNFDFQDCGILIVDCRTEKLLILAAGHGGNGTRGCIDVLTQSHDEVANRIIATRDAKDSSWPPIRIGENRLIDVVVTNIKKPTKELIDDIQLDSADFFYPPEKPKEADQET